MKGGQLNTTHQLSNVMWDQALELNQSSFFVGCAIIKEPISVGDNKVVLKPSTWYNM